MKKQTVIGIMSGTSLDGVDLACIEFSENENNFKFHLQCAETIPYSNEWINRLKNLVDADAVTFTLTHVELGTYFGNLVNEFISKNNLQVDFISSHGHTIFHQPLKKVGSWQSAVGNEEKKKIGFTSQIGDGAVISALTKLPVVCDFRTVDVALGGQGAPLVPIGDKYLFGEYDFCLNLGGIANISFNDEQKERIAFDICPVNMILNQLASERNFAFDNNGEMAKSGVVNDELLLKLNELDFYKQSPPKSLGYEWFKENFLPVVEKTNDTTENKLRTVCEHTATQIAATINSKLQTTNYKLLITGGGTFNKFLIQLLKAKCQLQIIIPDKEIINYKEAIIFAFLGLLRMQNKINTLASVTGAKSDSSGGAVYNASGSV